MELVAFCLKNAQHDNFKMRKASASKGDGDEMVCYGISHGGYVTSDEEMALPNYLVHLPSQNDVIVDIYVGEELNERGNGGDLDDGCGDARDFDDTIREVEFHRSLFLLGDDGIEKADDGGDELCVDSCWGHYIPIRGQDPQSSR